MKGFIGERGKVSRSRSGGPALSSIYEGTAVRENTHDRERGAAYDLYEIGPAAGAREAAVVMV